MNSDQLLNIQRTLSVMISYKCNAQCNDCGTLSSPRISTNLSSDTICSAIGQAGKLNFKNIVFTGGEATLFPKQLVNGIMCARHNKMMTRLVSNAVWARNPDKAHSFLAKLVQAGLNELNLSTGPEHQRFVPEEFVVNAIQASIRLGLSCTLMIEKRLDSNISKDDFLAANSLLDDYNCNRFGIIESPWMSLSPSDSSSYPQAQAANSENLYQYKGCDSVLQTYVIGTEGVVHSCCGIGSRLIEELKSTQKFSSEDPQSLEKIIFEAEQDFLKLWMRTEGPEHILAWCSNQDASVQWENLYSHRCQACLRLYTDQKCKSVIFNNYQSKIPDVLLRALLSTSLKHIVDHTREARPSI